MTANLFTYHIIEGELRSLRHDVTINGHHGAAIVVDAVSVTAPLVGVQVDSSALQRHQQTASRTTLPRVRPRIRARTLVVAALIRLTLWSALRSSWWLADELVKISTPSRPI